MSARPSAARTWVGIAASCTYGSTLSSSSSPSAAWAAAPARSSPSSNSDSPSTWAWSCSRSAGESVTDADERSPNPIDPSSRTTTRSRSMRRWVIPASCRRSRSAHSPATDRSSIGGVVAGRLQPGPQRDAVGADDDEGVATTGAAGGDEVGDADAGAVGEQRDEPLVLDQLEPAQADLRLGVPVPGQPPQVGEELAVPGVPAVDLHGERAVGVGAVELERALTAHRGRGQLVDVQPEARQREADAGRRRPAAGRADDHVHDRRRRGDRRRWRRRRRSPWSR